MSLNRTRSELEWLNKTKGNEEPYDLSPPVDEKYVTP